MPKAKNEKKLLKRLKKIALEDDKYMREELEKARKNLTELSKEAPKDSPKFDIRVGPIFEPPTLFDVAKKLVYGDRQKEYGDFRVQYTKALRMYTEWKDGFHSPSRFHVENVADLMMMMVFIKLSRESNQSKEDNIVDAIGYLEMYSRAKNER